MKYFVFLVIFCGQIVQLKAQGIYFENSSFEGSPGGSEIPYGWSTCNSLSTPDTQPGFLNITLTAKNGSTYMGLNMRGSEGPNIPKNEDLQTKILKPLLKGVKYKLSIDLAAALYCYEEHDGLRVDYNNPPRLRISAGNNYCVVDEILNVSDLITNTVWEQYDFEIVPLKNTYNYLKLEIYLDTQKASYLLLDNIQLTEANPESNSINIPNSFSPNGDGINDFFLIRGLTENSKLLIFNRIGQKLYESNNYQNNWDGKDDKGNILETGTYWYVLILSGIPTEFKGFVYLKR